MNVEELAEVPAERLERLEEENSRLQERLELASRSKVGIVWRDKPEDVEDLLRVALPILKEVPDRHIEGTRPGSAPPHLVLEGDNLHALTTLQYTHRNKVDLIYIDPPYNTGKKDTFAYNDRWITEDDPDYHSTWLSFMHRRLRLAHELLRPDGVIVIAIGDEEQHRLRMLCDQTFGEKNFIANVVWDASARENDKGVLVSRKHDYMLIYAKSRRAMPEDGWFEPKKGYDDLWSAYEAGRELHGGDHAAVSAHMKRWLKEPWLDIDGEVRTDSRGKALTNKDRLEKGLRPYVEVDEKGPYRLTDISWPGGGGPRYDVLHPVTGKPCAVPDPGWRFAEPARMRAEIEAGRIAFGPDETKVPQRIYRLNEMERHKPKGVFESAKGKADRQLTKMIGRGKFQYSKEPTELARWISIVLGNRRNATILDFFAGSGSTLQAVAALNEDGASHQCILVTNNEGKKNGKPTADAGKDGIAQRVTYPRLRAILTGKWADGKAHNPLPGSVRWFQTEFVPSQQGRDDLLTSLAVAATDLAAIRENTYERVAAVDRKWALLANIDRSAFTLVWLDPYPDDLQKALESADTAADRKAIYAFSYDDANPEWVDPLLREGWRVEPFPTRLHAALRRHHRTLSE